MMIRVCYVAMIVLCAASALKSGELQFSPIQPKVASDTVQIEYNVPFASLKKAKDLHLICYVFTANDQKPYAVQYKLFQMDPSKPDQAVFRTAFVPKDDAVLILMKISDGNKFTDNNNEEFWEMICTSKQGSYIPGSTFRRILTYTDALPKPCARKMHPEKAVELLKDMPKDEIGMFHKNYLKALLGYMTKEIPRDSLQSKIANILLPFQPNYDNEPEFKAFSQALRIIGKGSIADSVEKIYESIHPLDEFCEDAAANRVFSSASKEMFLENAEYFMKKYSYSPSMIKITEGYVRVQIQSGNLLVVAARLLRDPAVPVQPCLDIAEGYIARDSLKEALRWAERGANVAKDIASVIQPKYMANVEFAPEQSRDIAKSLMLTAFIHKLQKNFAQSLALYKEILTKYPHDLPASQMTLVYQFTTELLDALSNQKEAYLYASKAISEGVENQKIIEDFKKLHEFLFDEKSDSKAFELAFKELKNQGELAIKNRLYDEMLEISAIPATLKDMKGNTIQISDWKGKVVFLDFWATWCGPCKKSFPGLQKLYDKYKDNPKVQFAIVNCWERAEDRKVPVKEFLEKNPYTFPVFFDEKDKLVSAYGVTGIPTKFILDKQGIGRFMEIGMEEEIKFIEDFTQKIDVLLAD